MQGIRRVSRQSHIGSAALSSGEATRRHLHHPQCRSRLISPVAVLVTEPLQTKVRQLELIGTILLRTCVQEPVHSILPPQQFTFEGLLLLAPSY